MIVASCSSTVVTSTVVTTEITHISFAGPVYEVVDANGKKWHFEYHPYLGPTLITMKGEPFKRFPSEHSPFWEAFGQWVVPHEHRNCTCGVTTS